MATLSSILYKNATLLTLLQKKDTFNSSNPHANILEYFINNSSIDAYAFSCYASNKAIEMMMYHPELVDINGLVLNKHSKIGLLLEKYMGQFDHVHWIILSSSQNPAILRFLARHPENINWKSLSGNKYPDAICILKANLDKIDWTALSENPSAIEILENNQERINWHRLSGNPNAIHLIEQNLHKVSWVELCKNPNAINIIERNMSKIHWTFLYANPTAIHILEQHLHHADYIDHMALLKNPNAMKIMSKYPDMFAFEVFLQHKDAGPYIETQLDRITRDNLHLLAQNPCGPRLIQKMLDMNLITVADLCPITHLLLRNEYLYELDYKMMGRNRVDVIYYELIAKALHPDIIDRRLKDFLKNGGAIEDFYN
jgi:hypothetical protein